MVKVKLVAKSGAETIMELGDEVLDVGMLIKQSASGTIMRAFRYAGSSSLLSHGLPVFEEVSVMSTTGAFNASGPWVKLAD